MSLADNNDNIQVFPLLVSPNASLPVPAVQFAPSAPPNFTESDLTGLNELAKLLLLSPTTPFPAQTIPGPNARSQKIAKAKDDGNLHFKKGDWADAVRLYTLAADLAVARPITESSVYARDELAVSLCNRSAAYTNMKEWVNALADAKAVIEYKPSWTKGHFRKGKALIGMGRLDEAKEAYLLGLQFDPSTEVSTVPPRCYKYFGSSRCKIVGSHQCSRRVGYAVEDEAGDRSVISGAGVISISVINSQHLFSRIDSRRCSLSSLRIAQIDRKLTRQSHRAAGRTARSVLRVESVPTRLGSERDKVQQSRFSPFPLRVLQLLHGAQVKSALRSSAESSRFRAGRNLNSSFAASLRGFRICFLELMATTFETPKTGKFPSGMVLGPDGKPCKVNCILYVITLPLTRFLTGLHRVQSMVRNDEEESNDRTDSSSSGRTDRSWNRRHCRYGF